METIGFIGIIYKDYRVYIWGIYWDSGKESGNYYNGVIKGLGFRDCQECL